MTSTRVRTLTTTLVTGLIATGMALTTSPAGAAPATAAVPTTHTDFPGPRSLVRHVVRPGETAGGLAVKYHAWTAELISYNHLGSSGRLYAGQEITIPVVPASLRHSPDAKAPATKPARTAKAAPAPKATKQTWRHADPSRAAVRSAIIRTAKAHGVDPRLALAISWQESGWQMHHVSHADAIGAMQVLPGTGTWMSLYADRPLELTHLEDNVLAGVLLLDFLGDNTSSTRHQVAAYYQGLRAVRERGLYDDTQAYVANVFAIRDQIARGWNPA